jgi:RND family efflux transporter MFP subunit
MLKFHLKSSFYSHFLIAVAIFLFSGSASLAEDKDKSKGPPPVPVRVAIVEKKMVSDQISLVGTAEAIARSIVAAEVSGVVEHFPVKEGEFVKKGKLLVRLRSTYLKLRLKGAFASREKIKANLQNAEKELNRVLKLKETNSIAEKNFDLAFYSHRALSQELLQKDAEIEQLEYEIKQKKVLAPFSGFVAKEHTQVGEWIDGGGPVVTLLDLEQIRITVDVPERYAVMLIPQGEVKVMVRSISNDLLAGRIFALLPQANPDSRTFPVRINIANPEFKIKSGMEAMVTFNLATSKNALLIPKDAIVTQGNNKLVFFVADGQAMPVNVKVLGYYDGDVAVEGNLEPGTPVVIRGNERLRPGQAVNVIE